MELAASNEALPPLPHKMLTVQKRPVAVRVFSTFIRFHTADIFARLAVTCLSSLKTAAMLILEQAKSIFGCLNVYDNLFTRFYFLL